ncbi:multiple cyclophane-containing RiPP AmcA [Kitasatospora azatica]|uniref:multiple cyclophane-containing RiPP AmcA n=1 Tax=Kitasatospora azatica TaxID=58347 RepID=UPI000ABB366B|nr:multiple cyclophane-containing RiPP AmcA [Kitasatospora azatica]
MTMLEYLAEAQAPVLTDLTSAAAGLVPTAKFDNRPTWNNNTPKFDNRPTWDNWNKAS